MPVSGRAKQVPCWNPGSELPVQEIDLLVKPLLAGTGESPGQVHALQGKCHRLMDGGRSDSVGLGDGREHIAVDGAALSGQLQNVSQIEKAPVVGVSPLDQSSSSIFLSSYHPFSHVWDNTIIINLLLSTMRLLIFEVRNADCEDVFI